MLCRCQIKSDCGSNETTKFNFFTFDGEEALLWLKKRNSRKQIKSDLFRLRIQLCHFQLTVRHPTDLSISKDSSLISSPSPASLHSNYYQTQLSHWIYLSSLIIERIRLWSRRKSPRVPNDIKLSCLISPPKKKTQPPTEWKPKPRNQIQLSRKSGERSIEKEDPPAERQPKLPETSIERARRRSKAWKIFTCSVQTHKSWFATVAAAAGGRVVPIPSSRDSRQRQRES